MRPSRTAASPFALAFAAGLVALSACDEHSHGGPAADEYFYDCENNPAGLSVYATDESFVELINKEAANGLKTDDTQAAHLTSPAPGAKLSIASPPQWMFRVGPMARGPGRGGRACPVARARRWDRLVRALSPIGVAHAHCPAVNGDNFLFRLAKEGNSKALYTAQLSVTSFTPNAARWSKALAGLAGQTVVVTLARAVYSKGSITNGPFVASTPYKFTVGE
jgi:hypothetical protein